MKRIGVYGMKKVAVCLVVLLALYAVFGSLMPDIKAIVASEYGLVGLVTLNYAVIAICVYIVQGLIFGLITRSVASSKGYDGGFWWGFFLGILGLIVVAVRPTMTKVESDQGNTAANYTQALERLAAMRDQGILTEEEFKEKKQEILDRI